MPRHLILVGFVFVGACHRETPSSGSAAASSSPATSSPSRACAASCTEGVCIDCPTSVIALDPSSKTPSPEMAIWGTRLAWRWNYNHLSYRELCGAGPATEIPHGDGVTYWSVTPDGLLYQRDMTWHVHDARGAERDIPLRAFGYVKIDRSSHAYAAEPFIDNVSIPHRSGWDLERDGKFVSSDTLPEILIDGDDAYFVEGKLLRRRSAGGKLETLLSTTDEHAPAPIAKVDDVVYAVSGWSRSITYGPQEHFALYEVRAGRMHAIYTADDVSCLATNRHGVAICVHDVLMFVPFSGAPAKRLLPIDEPNHLASDMHTGVALGEDGTIAWSIRSEPTKIRVRRPACE